METELDRGIIVTGGVVTLAALAANAVALFQVSNFVQQIGTKSFIVKKLRVRNNAAGNLWLTLGLGIPGVASMPLFFVLNGMDGVWQEFELPAVEFFADLTAFVSAIVVGGTVEAQVEVEERG